MGRKLANMLMVMLTVEDARERLGLSAAQLQQVIDAGEITVDETRSGPRIPLVSVEQFEEAERARTRHGMEELTALSNALGFTE